MQNSRLGGGQDIGNTFGLRICRPDGAGADVGDRVFYRDVIPDGILKERGFNAEVSELTAQPGRLESVFYRDVIPLGF